MIITREDLIRSQKQGMPPAIEGVSLDDQTVVITGANTGLGYEAAKHFAIRRPGKLVLVCRDERKGQEALDKLKAETKFENAHLWVMDLASFDSVKAVRKKVDELDRLDILVENAGVAKLTYDLTSDGWERSLQVNVISTTLHMILHIPKMLETAKRNPKATPRIVVVSSGTHYWSTIPTEAIDAPSTLEFLNEEKYALEQLKGIRRYPETKLLATFLPRMFQSHLPPPTEPNITCCNVGPGFCDSGLTREMTPENASQAVIDRLNKDKKDFAFTSEEGSRQLLYAAIGHRDREEELRGGYVAMNKVTECSDWILSEEGQRLEKKLWGELVDVVGGIDETAKGIIQRYLS